jgi:Domain of unknown function (DUF4234)
MAATPPPPPPGSNPGAAVAPGTGQVGKRRNSFLVWFVWPLITLGIYHLVWWYKINREVRDFDRRIVVSPGVAVLALVPGFLLIVPPFVSVYRTGARIRQAQQAAGLQNTVSPGLGLLLSFLLSLHTLYYQSQLNGLWATYGTPPEFTQVPLRA